MIIFPWWSGKPDPARRPTWTWMKWSATGPSSSSVVFSAVKRPCIRTITLTKVRWDFVPIPGMLWRLFTGLTAKFWLIYFAEFQRHLPHRHAYRRRSGDQSTPPSGSPPTLRCFKSKVARIQRHHQNWPHSYSSEFFGPWKMLFFVLTVQGHKNWKKSPLKN